MLQDFGYLDSLLGVNLQHPSQKIESLGIHVLVKRTVKVELHLLVVFIDLISLFSLEELPSNKHNMENGTQRKNIALWLDVISL
jgi:hypothetical protein